MEITIGLCTKRQPDKNVSLKVQIAGLSGRAVKVSRGDREEWISYSQVHDMQALPGTDFFTITIPEALALDKVLI